MLLSDSIPQRAGWSRHTQHDSLHTAHCCDSVLLPAAQMLYVRTPLLSIVELTGRLSLSSPTIRGLGGCWAETTFANPGAWRAAPTAPGAAIGAGCRAGRGGFDYPVAEAGLSTEPVVRRTAPHSPVPTPMTAPPRPINCCER